jgi:hypothetical protein
VSLPLLFRRRGTAAAPPASGGGAPPVPPAPGPVGGAFSGTPTIRIRPLGGQWEVLGVDRLRGLWPEGIEASANDWGPDGLSFRLAAEEGARRPDLLPYTPIELELGMLCWSGFVWQRPAEENSYQVVCRGWQYHLDDDLLERAYVHTRLGEYRDQRTYLGANLSLFRQNGNVATSEGGGVTIGYQEIQKVVPGDRVGVTLDLGPDSLGKRVVMQWKSTNNVAGLTCFVRGTSVEDANSSDFNDFLSFTMNAGAAGTSTGTATTARRYIHVFLYDPATTYNPINGDVSLQIVSLQVFRDIAYESGNTSVLKADAVIKDALATAPLLNQSTALIGGATFALPSYVTGGYASPRVVMEAVNVVENYRLKIGGSDLRTIVYGPKPSAPIVEVGDWSGAQFSDATMSGEEIYDRGIVDATGPDGARLVSKRTQTGTLVDRNGFHRARRIDVSSAVTSAVADRIADLWLTEHRTAPFAGTLKITGGGARRVVGGTTIQPHEFLLYAGEKVRLANRIDPDTGAWGRDGRIAGVTYRHDDRSVEIAIDDQRKKFETILARYAALVGG